LRLFDRDALTDHASIVACDTRSHAVSGTAPKEDQPMLMT
jgi:hypothetical protein